MANVFDQFLSPSISNLYKPQQAPINPFSGQSVGNQFINNAKQGSVLGTDTQAPPPVAPPQNTGGGGGGGFTLPQSTGPSRQEILSNAQIAAENQKKQQQQQFNQYTTGLGKIYQPIIGNLQAQLGQIPGRLDQAKKAITDQYGNSVGVIQGALNTGISSLNNQSDLLKQAYDAAQQGIQTQSKYSLADIGDTVVNALKSAGQYLGARGAGSSSTANVISENLATEAMKARGKEISNRNQALQSSDINYQGDIASIGNAKAELQQKYQSQVADLENWKIGQVQQASEYYTQLKDSISADVTKTEAEKAQLLQQAQLGLMQNLSEIDNQVTDYSQQLDYEAYSNDQQLENYAKQLQLAAQAQTSGNYGGNYTPTSSQIFEMGQNQANYENKIITDPSSGVTWYPQVQQKEDKWQAITNNGQLSGKFNPQTGEYVPTSTQPKSSGFENYINNLNPFN